MGEVLMQPMGGGIGSDDVTAAKAHVLAGHNTVTTDSDDEVVEGTMPDRGQWQYGKSLVHAFGYYAMNQLPEGYYHADGADWAPEVRMEDAVAKQSQMWSDAYSAGVSDADSRVNTNSASYKSKYLRYIGSGGNGNYSATGILGWQGLTKDNFVFVPTKVHYQGSTYNNDDASYIVLGNGVTGDVYPSISYNSWNGIVTVSGCHGQLYSQSANSHGVQANVTVTGNVYCLV